MMILDVNGQGLFSHSGQFLSVAGDALKLIAGSLGIMLWAIFSIIVLSLYSVYKAVERSSLQYGFRIFLRSIAYGAGIGLALLFMLITSIFFSISFFKLLLIASIIAFATAFIVRETVLFLILKRFGKYIFYLTTLHRASKVVYTYAKQENQNPVPPGQSN